MTHVLGLYTGVVFEREEKKWLPLARTFLSVQLVKVQNKHELVYRVWAYQGNHSNYIIVSSYSNCSNRFR